MLGVTYARAVLVDELDVAGVIVTDELVELVDE